MYLCMELLPSESLVPIRPCSLRPLPCGRPSSNSPAGSQPALRTAHSSAVTRPRYPRCCGGFSPVPALLADTRSRHGVCHVRAPQELSSICTTSVRACGVCLPILSVRECCALLDSPLIPAGNIQTGSCFLIYQLDFVQF